jgi:hypothetical protein
MGRAYGPTHYGMGLTMTTLTFKANRANKGHDQQDNQRPGGGYLLPFDALGGLGDDDEGHDKTTSHRTASEPPPCQ